MTGCTPVGISIAAVAMLAVPAAWPSQPYGAPTPEEAVAGFNEALHLHDAGAAAQYVAPSSRRQLVIDVLSEIAMVLQHFDPAMAKDAPGTQPNGHDDAKRSGRRSAVDLADEALAPFGLAGVFTADPDSLATDWRVTAALEREDTAVLIAELFGVLPRLGSRLFGADPDDPALHDLPIRLTTGVTVSGDEATAMAGTYAVRFERIQGRWYIVQDLIWQLPHRPRGA